MNAGMRGRFGAWLERRIPRARRVTLDQRRIFIAPSRAGAWFLVGLALMFLVAVNYQNNLAFALVFLLFSVLVVSIFHTFANLAGLVLEGLGGQPTFAGERAEFRVRVSAMGGRERHGIGVGWPEQAMAGTSLLGTGTAELQLFHAAPRRGLLRPGRILLESAYPLGLIRAWSWVDLDLTALVYPDPRLCAAQSVMASDADPEGRREWQPGSDDFHGFRSYRAGDNPRHVLWRAAAKDQPLQTLQFADAQLPTEYLRWDAVSGEPEERLRKLCHLVLECARQGRPFGLALPGISIPPASGDGHKSRALAELALFGCGERPT